MKFTRQNGYDITFAQINCADDMTTLKQEILCKYPDYPLKYLKPWYKNTRKLLDGIADTSSGPGTEYTVGMLTCIHELRPNLLDNALKSLSFNRKNLKKEQAINDFILSIK